MATQATLKSILEDTRVIALVGASKNPARPSASVARFLIEKGYRVIPVNPGLAGQTLWDEQVFASLDDIPSDAQVDMVDIFRTSDAVPGIVDQALNMPGLKTIWMQIGVEHAEAAARAEAAGLTVVQNRCPKIEYMRLIESAAD